MPNTMARKRSFQEILDADNCDLDIDFAENLPTTAIFLSTPDPTDTLLETYKKVDRLAALVREGKSLAIHTNHAKPPRDAITEVKKTMTVLETVQCEAHIRGAIMPTIDWTQSRGLYMILRGPGVGRFDEQLRAIREIYRDPRITPRNASWFMTHFPYAMPLVDAVAKVQATQQKYVDDQRNRTDMGLAEVNTARGIVSVAINTLAERRMSEEQRKVDRLAARIRLACEVIQDHVDAIQAQGGYGGAEEPEMLDDIFWNLSIQ
ncbi:hypothetical protein N7471_009074 [Penicillium samsonianum]|uniref:uncharacterized protein n=1 Tax=Penicillium samsonianum TaxID=1882272 RepID=UPI002548365C|nr:uncharacterized protein N7471_009074 [Penicillium samsonianum]KAJ6127857.1 hypothetical protein N7471_009074 [Penicillium samsonianum]